MSKERDPRVVAIAEELVKIQPYGKDWRKTKPSVADYHAALIAVRTLDEQAEFEYNIEYKDEVTGRTHLYRTLWEPNMEWLQRKIDEAEAYDRKLRNAGGSPEYTRRLVKRRKAGRIEDV